MITPVELDYFNYYNKSVAVVSKDRCCLLEPHPPLRTPHHDNKRTHPHVGRRVDFRGNWGGWIRTIDTGSKGPCLTSWPHPSVSSNVTAPLPPVKISFTLSEYHSHSQDIIGLTGYPRCQDIVIQTEKQPLNQRLAVAHYPADHLKVLGLVDIEPDLRIRRDQPAHL